MHTKNQNLDIEIMDTPIFILNSICQENSIVPTYMLLSKEGKVHAPIFTYRVQVLDIVHEASGKSKKKAKHAAAHAMVQSLIKESKLRIDDTDDLLKRLENMSICDEHEFEPQQQQTNDTNTEGAAPAGDDGDVGQSNDNSDSKINTNADDSNPIGKLQEICMKKIWQSPQYDFVGEEGMPHERMFNYTCYIENMDLREPGGGKSKKLAKRAAAQAMLNKLRKENLDKIDEILDRIPRNINKNATFDIFSEIVKAKKNHDWHQTEEKSRNQFFYDLSLNEDKIEQLKPMFSNNVPEFIQRYMGNNTVTDVEKLIQELITIINCRVELSVHPEKSSDFKYQCWSDFVPNDPQYENASVFCSFSSDEDLEKAKLKALSRSVLLFLCQFRDNLV